MIFDFLKSNQFDASIQLIPNTRTTKIGFLCQLAAILLEFSAKIHHNYKWAHLADTAIQQTKFQRVSLLGNETPNEISHRRFYLSFLLVSGCVLLSLVACVASVSVQFGSKELQGDEWRFWLSPHFPRRQNTENPVPRSFFAPKPYGNACYAGYIVRI